MAVAQQTECGRNEFSLVCDICEEEEALSFCDECEVKLGEVCQSAHMRQKATSSHIVTDIRNTNLSQLNEKCSSCENQAAMFCPICQDYFCGKCSTLHQKLKITKTHKLVDIMSSKTVVKDDGVSIENNGVPLKTENIKCTDECEEMLKTTDDKTRDDRMSLTNVKNDAGDMQLTLYDNKDSDGCDVQSIKDPNHSTDSCDQVQSQDETGTSSENSDGMSQSIGANFCSENKDVMSPITVANKPSENKDVVLTNIDVTSRNTGAYNISENNDVISLNTGADKPSENKDVVLTNNDVTSRNTGANNISENDDVISQNTVADKPSENKDVVLTNNDVTSRNTGANNISESKDVISLNTGTDKSSENNDVVLTNNDVTSRNTGANNISENEDVLSPNTGANTPSENNDVMSPNTRANKPSENNDVMSPNTGANRPSDDLEMLRNTKDDIRSKEYLERQKTADDTPIEVCEGRIGETMSPITEMIPESVEIQQRINDNATRTDQRGYGGSDNVHETTPGKPYTLNVSTDYIHIAWVKPAKVSETDTYQVKYKEEACEKWKFYPVQFEQNQGKVDGLKSDTAYLFNVRTVHSYGESPYSENSDLTKTHATFASQLVHVSEMVGNENTIPHIYSLPITNMHSNVLFKSEKYEIGRKSEHSTIDKTIMLLGATGTGKSTFVDGIANYVLGVNFSNPYRFTVFDMDDRKKQTDQAISQTDCITCYSFNPQKGTRTNYTLNVIDTPGFGDTRGLHRDQIIVEQIRNLFEQTGEMGVQNIDAVCFLVKSPDARLTTTQTYIFNAIMSLFGNDIEQNICTLITFADGSDSPVLSAIKGSGMPFGRYFTFNNSALFAQTAADANTLAPMFWDMGKKSFDAFFDHLQNTESKSIQLTREVLHERHCLEVSIQNLQPQIDAALSTIQRIRDEMRLFEENEDTIKANKDFEYEVTETKQKKIDLPWGRHVTNCLQCNMTCHENCKVADDEKKARCSVMDPDGMCRECVDNCHWSQHKNTPYIFKYVNVKVVKTYNNMLEKYQEAEGKQMSFQQVLMKMNSELDELTVVIENMMEKIKDCNNRLKEIALRPNPLGIKDQIELMIMSEEKEQKDGYILRIRVLHEFLRKASINERVRKFREEKSNLHKTTQAIAKRKPTNFDKIRNFFGLGK